MPADRAVSYLIRCFCTVILLSNPNCFKNGSNAGERDSLHDPDTQVSVCICCPASFAEYALAVSLDTATKRRTFSMASSTTSPTRSSWMLAPPTPARPCWARALPCAAATPSCVTSSRCWRCVRSLAHGFCEFDRSDGPFRSACCRRPLPRE